MPRPAYCHLIVGPILLLAGILRAAPVSTQPSASDAQVKGATGASNEFAFDLYAHLGGSRDNAGKNLFFSPYSISNALTMAAEGARGETAEQMGRVLRFPHALHREGGDAQAIPWDMGPLHVGIAALAEQLVGDADRPEMNEIRRKIDGLRKELDAANAPIQRALKKDPFDLPPQNNEAGEKIADQLNELFRQIDPYELRVANAIWVEKIFPLRQAYVAAVSRFYGGAAFSLDFLHDPDGARRQINAWIEQQTHGRFRELIPPDIRTEEPIGLVVANAVYFRGEWLDPFSADQTTNEAFTATGQAKVRVALMHKNSMKSVRYAAFNSDGSFFATPEMIPVDTDPNTAPRLYPGKDGLAMVELPYKGDRLSMVVIAPVDEAGIDGLEKNLAAKMFDQWTSRLVARKTHVFLPKFKLEAGYEMISTLKSMGMERAFKDPRKLNGAEFDGMFEDPRTTCYVTEVRHKACIEVNEKGTEAAAVTAIRGPVFGAARRTRMKPFIPTFRADRPFIFAIRDTGTGLILFLGQVANPTQ